jgi:hypothetical protein
MLVIVSIHFSQARQAHESRVQFLSWSLDSPRKHVIRVDIVESLLNKYLISSAASAYACVLAAISVVDLDGLVAGNVFVALLQMRHCNSLLVLIQQRENRNVSTEALGEHPRFLSIS